MSSIAWSHSQADLVRWLIIDLGEGSDPLDSLAWPVSATMEPHTPDNCITVYDTEGFNTGRDLVSGRILEKPGIQVRLRSVDHKTGYVKMMALRRALSEGWRNRLVTVDTTTYLIYSLVKFSPIASLGKESSSGRRLFTFNCLINAIPYTFTPGEETGTGTTSSTAYEILDENGDAILDENGLSIYDEFYV